jgi:xanthine dehydrogenase YagS FAD-binding subunit
LSGDTLLVLSLYRGYRGTATVSGKGSGSCLAVKGDNRYHAIIGGKKCFAVCFSDMAVAIAALDGKCIITGLNGERIVAPADFFHSLGNALSTGEMFRKIEIPTRKIPTRQSFLKFTLRKPVDFAIVSVAAIIVLEEKICRKPALFSAPWLRSPSGSGHQKSC